MSEKKHIFKVALDDQNLVLQRGEDDKYYGIKLIGKNGEEVVLNQPYAATYSIRGEKFNYVIPEDNIATTKSIKLDSAVIDVIKGDKNSGYKLVLKDKNNVDDGAIIPKGSWYFHDQNINSMDYNKQLYIDGITDDYCDHIKVTDKSGLHILSLMSTNKTFISDHGSFALSYRDSEKLDKTPIYVTVLECYKNANNKPLIVYYSDKNGNRYLSEEGRPSSLDFRTVLETFTSYGSSTIWCLSCTLSM